MVQATGQPRRPTEAPRPLRILRPRGAAFPSRSRRSAPTGYSPSTAAPPSRPRGSVAPPCRSPLLGIYPDPASPLPATPFTRPQPVPSGGRRRRLYTPTIPTSGAFPARVRARSLAPLSPSKPFLIPSLVLCSPPPGGCRSEPSRLLSLASAAPESGALSPPWRLSRRPPPPRRRG